MDSNVQPDDNGIPDPSTWVDPLMHPYLKHKPRSTLYRWLQDGRLRSIRIGVEYITTQKWIEDFILSSSATSEQPTKNPRSTQRQRRTEVEQARRNIEARRNRLGSTRSRGPRSEPNPKEE